jgi:hypothetical protein
VWPLQFRAYERGRSGIRTHEGLAPLTVFKTVAFVRSAILPDGGYGSVPSSGVRRTTSSLTDHPGSGSS